MSSQKVHEIVENMADELNSYKSRKIFAPAEIQQIIEIRKKHEMKLQRTKKNLADFTNYIKRELKLLRKRNKKISKGNLPFEESDKKLEKNILRIFKKAFEIFNDSQLLKEFGEFCVKNGFAEEMKAVFGKILLKNLKNDDLWVFCAKKFWEINDIESARNTLIKSMPVCEKQSVIHVELFKLECLYANQLCRFNREMCIPEEKYGNVEKGEIALEIYRAISSQYTETEIKQCLRISKMVPGLTEKIKNL
ncbi:hypothetical protein NUSPORA_02733 [Nucleospora cyclopteri]